MRLPLAREESKTNSEREEREENRSKPVLRPFCGEVETSRKCPEKKEKSYDSGDASENVQLLNAPESYKRRNHHEEIDRHEAKGRTHP